MAALPSISGERAVRVFQKTGWVKDRQRGSHVNSSANAARVDPATRMSVDEFVALM
ncbi:MAG TPA: hypothetical protein VM120_23485 [Bryobacteraceae bacterium]|nr:hypothetical protein [Bryobacteraceae bacterium]